MPGASLSLHIFIGIQVCMVVFSHTAFVEVDNFFYVGQVFLGLDNFVDLLLIFNDHKTGTAMFQHIGHFFGVRIVIKRHRNSATELCGSHGPIKIGAVTADNGDMIAFVKT